MEFLKDPRLPWSVKHMIVQIAFGPRCVLCDERRGQLCRIDDVYELRCLTFVNGMMDNEVPFPEPLVDGIIRAEWSFVSCPIGSSLRDLSSVSEYSVLGYEDFEQSADAWALHAGLPAVAAETSASCGLPAAATACWADLYVAGDSRFFEACLLTGDWEPHFSRESQYSDGAGHRRLHRNMQCYFSIVPGCATLPTFLCYAMLCHSISTALKLSSSSDCALSVSLLLYCIKQWDQSNGKSANIVNIGSFIPICVIQMASRFVHGVGISIWVEA